MKRTGCWAWLSYVILGLGGLFLIVSAWTVSFSSYPGYAANKSKTVNQFEDYRYAMNRYHDHYSRFPVHCTNVAELACVLNGENINNDNPDKIKFFAREKPLSKRVLDGFGYPLDLSIGANGTNFILKSYGTTKRRNYERNRRTSTAFTKLDIAMLYTQPLADARARRMDQAKSLPLSSTTNHLAPIKETNHVDSISQ